MSAASEETMIEILDLCLSELAAGTGLDDLLSRYPFEAAELRPLLETALLAKLPGEVPPPSLSAKVASKNRFLDAAQAKTKKATRGWFPQPLRMAGTLLLVLVVFFASLTVGASLVSAQALPGDPLYSVKRAIERVDRWLATSPASRLALEERLDSRRADEVQRLVDQGRAVEVRFAGFLTAGPQGWLAAGIPLAVAGEQDARLGRLAGSYVEVAGQTRPGVVNASEIQLRLFHLDGVVQKLEGDLWVVDGVEVRLDPATRLRGSPLVGAVVQITAIRVEVERLLALSVWVRGSSAPQAVSTDPPVAPDTLKPTRTPLAPSAVPQVSATPAADETIEATAVAPQSTRQIDATAAEEQDDASGSDSEESSDSEEDDRDSEKDEEHQEDD